MRRHRLIEADRDIRTERLLDRDGMFGSETLCGAVEMRPELDAMRPNFPNLRQAEHLEPAAVRQDRQIPIHEFVQVARGLNNLETRPNAQMIGVPEKDLRAHLVEFARVDRLHASLRSHRHEYRRVDRPARRRDAPQSRL